MAIGRVTFYNHSQGYGFAVDDNAEKRSEAKAYLHASEFLSRSDLDLIEVGSIVQYDAGPGRDAVQCRALRVKLLEK